MVRLHRTPVLGFATAFLLGIAGCTHEQVKPAPSPEALTAKLAQADAKDGTTDKIVSKCAGCALHMDGKSENALTLQGYTLHFCNAGCKERFGKDLEGSVAALKID